MIRVLIADDEALLRAGLRALLAAESDITLVGEAADGEESVRLAREARPDVILMDTRMRGIDGVEATRRLAADPDLADSKVLILTTLDGDERLFEALRCGASGVLVKDSDRVELLKAVRLVAAWPELRGSATHQLDELTDREREVMILAAHGLTNQEIAQRLIISPATAKTHVSRAMVKGPRARPSATGRARLPDRTRRREPHRRGLRRQQDQRPPCRCSACGLARVTSGLLATFDRGQVGSRSGRSRAARCAGRRTPRESSLGG